MSATALEVLMLELINAERAAAGVAPLALADTLGLAADRHSDWMLATDTFSHAGIGGSDPGDRAGAAGYAFTGSWTWGENVAWVSTRGAPGLADEVALNHANLMDSPGHRANILDPAFREVGIGVRRGEFEGYDAAMVTQVFAASGTDHYVTGVAIEDADGDGAYDLGEGLGGIAVVASAGGVTIAADVTGPAGDYALALGPGTYTVTFDGDDARTVTVAGANVKLDHIAEDGAIVGDAAANVLRGTAGADAIEALGGDDRLFGLAGDDALSGGAGNDVLWGGAGADALDGGAGRDAARYDADGAVRADLLAPARNTGAARGDTYAGIEDLVGSGGNDVLLGDAGANALLGGTGHDWLVGRGGADVLRGGAGNDVMVGGADADVLDGGAGRDTVMLGSAATLDLLRGDLSTGEARGDRHVSVERALGSAGDDVIRGAGGGETLEGRGGHDVLIGRAGNDALAGGAGHDVLVGGAGADVLTGGEGRDLFRFDRVADSATGAGDLVRDFERGTDRLHLGFLDADAAAPGDQRLDLVDVFTGAGGEVRSVRGAVLIDLDGDRAPDMVVRIAGGLTLEAADFIL